MRVLRSLLGVALILAIMVFGPPILRLTNDLALRLVLIVLLLALAGAAWTLVWFNRRESSY